MEDDYIINKPEHLETDNDANELPWELIENGDVDVSELEKITSEDELKKHNEPSKTQEDEEKEKLQRAYETIEHKAPIIPGLGMVEPILPPKEKVELDPDEIPWELKNTNDSSEDENDIEE